MMIMMMMVMTTFVDREKIWLVILELIEWKRKNLLVVVVAVEEELLSCRRVQSELAVEGEEGEADHVCLYDSPFPSCLSTYPFW